MFRVIIRPDGHNPLTGRVRYRVADYWNGGKSNYGPFNRPIYKYCDGHWVINMTEPPRKGSFINPRKALGI